LNSPDFDLTVPLAHFVAKHHESLSFPFRRYQIQKVWRAERSQSGRYSEFYQCDIDVIGRGDLNILTDAELPSIIFRIFQEMGVGRFVIRISNAKILEEYLRHAGVSEQMLPAAKSIVDNLEKVGINRTVDSLALASEISVDKSREIIDFLIDKGTANDQVLETLGKISGSERFRLGVKELSSVVSSIRMFGVPDEFVRVDLSIARGLDYYTGTVYETVLVDHPGIGSICSGGRYDDLCGQFTEEKFPGVGISIGLTRLMGRLLSAGLIKAERATTAPVLVTMVNRLRMQEYIRIANELRAAGINTEIYLNEAPIGQQLRYANRKGFQVAIVAGDRELDRGCVQIKNLVIGDSAEHPVDSIVQSTKQILGLS
jgi:histidyl-tRNA synthetase